MSNIFSFCNISDAVFKNSLFNVISYYTDFVGRIFNVALNDVIIVCKKICDSIIY